MATVTIEQTYALARQAGATHDEAVILAAIAGGESSYNSRAYNGVNKDRSYGLWQINMLGQMGVDRQKQWGLKSYDDLYDPLVNARAAVSILRSQGWKAWSVYSNGSYKKYLSQAQAAGSKVGNDFEKYAAQGRVVGMAKGTAQQVNPQVGSTIGGPSGTGASGSMLAGGEGYTPASLPPNATPEQIEQHIRENYPQAAGFLDVPEIREKLIQGAREQWTPTKLQAEIQSTNWWRTNSAATREYYATKNTDPASFARLIDQHTADLTPMLTQIGIGGDPRVFAEEVIKYGWTDQEIRIHLGKQLQGQSGQTGLGEGTTVDVTADALLLMARNQYLVPLNRQDAERWAINIFSGTATEEQFRSYLQTQSAARFPGLSDSGVSPGEYLAPLRNVIADTLELQPADVDLLDRRWSEVLETVGTDGKFRPMTISEAQRWARSQKQYQYTKGARDEAADFAEMLGSTFGRV